jgi:dienelactone hydrolase
VEKKMKQLGKLLLIFLFSISFAHAEIIGKQVEYQAGGVLLKGYLAYDDSNVTKRPGVLVVHEWWGHNEYARKRAHMLAELGYTTLAVDMYGDGKQANHPDSAGKFAAEATKNMQQARQRFISAMQLLQRRPEVEKTDIAAIGYCFGGGVVLEMARMGVDLQAVVSFHGSLGVKTSPAEAGKVKAKVLVLNGADDPFVKPKQIEVFKREMESAKVDYRFINYPGVKHSFTNPDADRFGRDFGLPLQYDAEADQNSWAEMQSLFQQVFSR